ncbi:DUF6907 domain-containing protein [Streptomyces sp. WAC05950]|uniref:DUF6907 domain-containing protein n=1 Tax=Streptomyces sp. WAC05950 TaxID=2487419 RepID=UPI000F73D8D0|nr:hypothetical protein [Streptomyces sp. WAC05950]RST13477.1 hypothetical protein EF904_07285 [Streptomyces sp. WAC05950]
MGNTVPAAVPPVFHPEPKLSAVPTQPSAKNRETLAAPAPRTWTFIDSQTSKLQEVTCLPGCVVNHTLDRETPTHPEDIWCMTRGEDLYLPVVSGSEDVQELRVLSAFIRQEPFSKHLHERVPHAQLELVDDNYLESLDPDGLATVILALESQLATLRKVHAELSALREQGRVQL